MHTQCTGVAKALHHLEQHLWMLDRHVEQRPCGTGRRTAALLPVLDRAHRDAEQARELRLRRTGAGADIDQFGKRVRSYRYARFGRQQQFAAFEAAEVLKVRDAAVEARTRPASAGRVRTRCLRRLKPHHH